MPLPPEVPAAARLAAPAAPWSTGSTNPLLLDWTTPYGLPPFAAIQPEHFGPAFADAMAGQRREVDAIAGQAAEPTFANTVAALDASGRLLGRVERAFFHLAASATDAALQAVERDLAPRLAAHKSAILLDPRLAGRLDALHAQRDALGLSAEQRRLLERYRLDCRMAGAHLAPAARERLAAIAAEQASLHTEFAQNVLADEADRVVELAGPDDLAGLPAWLVDAARAAGADRGRAQPVIALSRSAAVAFLTCSPRSDLREAVFRAWKARGAHPGPHDNRPLAQRLLALRLEQAQLHGYRNYAEFALIDRMAGRPAAVQQLLDQVWAPACARALAERAEIETAARARGHAGPIEPWDWRYYAEIVRRERYALDEAELKPYFALTQITAAAFDCAQRLFGLRFTHRPDLPAYHPDVQVYEVHGRDGVLRAIFLHDNFARPNKRSGAWMSMLRLQSRATEGRPVVPIVVNNNNFARASQGETLLSLDDVRTLFHEFGHGLHGMLSDVAYERLAGTQVLRDFVELPSQLFEHWAQERTVLERHARHVDTGAPIPAALLDRIAAARRFNQGFETVGYTACALLDLALHQRTDGQALDLEAFERDELARLGLPAGASVYHQLPHFQHLFAGSAYAAGYYVYLWAEVLDADAYDAFAAAGDPFDAATAQRLLAHIYSTGNSVEPGAAFRAFRGRDPVVEPLLRKRGLADALTG